MRVRVMLWAATAVGMLAASGAAPAATPALVIEAETGRVLHAERATDPWYPASITKLMTTYVALDMVRSGKASLSTPLTMSALAASQPPSKMGFKPGTLVTLDNALKIIMVKSANDVATMIGENLGGSVEGFAALMNDAAARIGMRESRWYNPNGLPDDRQRTSARDMAILARALLREFPEHEPLFRIGALKLGPQIMRNHNGLLGRYPGADGMKTGFICAGGFNVVASATQNGRRIIAVVMGYPSARERDLRTADLLDEGFNSSAGWGASQVEALPPSGFFEPPNMRLIVCSPNKRQPEDDDEVAVVAGGTPAADNPIAALFQPTTLGNPASAAGAPILGSRRTLGPRVAFAPIPIFIGPVQGGAPDGEAPGVRLAARPVKTKPLGRTANAALPASARAFSPGLKPDADARIVETVKASPRAKPGAALADNLDGRPAADTKPRPGAIGAGASTRPRLGAIDRKPVTAVVEPGEDAPKPAGRKTAGRDAEARKAPARKADAKAARATKPEPATGSE